MISEHSLEDCLFFSAQGWRREVQMEVEAERASSNRSKSCLARSL